MLKQKVLFTPWKPESINLTIGFAFLLIILTDIYFSYLFF